MGKRRFQGQMMSDLALLFLTGAYSHGTLLGTLVILPYYTMYGHRLFFFPLIPIKVLLVIRDILQLIMMSRAFNKNKCQCNVYLKMRKKFIWPIPFSFPKSSSSFPSLFCKKMRKFLWTEPFPFSYFYEFKLASIGIRPPVDWVKHRSIQHVLGLSSRPVYPEMN